ncbi:MAG: hypothetical protein AAGH57_15550 [Pseudomonadota bacterium]
MPEWLPALASYAAVIAAVVGGAFLLIRTLIERSATKLQAEIQRENAKLSADIQRENASTHAKLSSNIQLAKFRQAWIDGLREDMAKFQSFGVTPELDQRTKREFYELGTRIELRLNPDDEDFTELHDAMYEFLDASNIAQKYSANPRFVAVCQRILKKEWDVLKGEVKSVARGDDDKPLRS